MLHKLFGKALMLHIGGQDIEFNSLAEFEFAMAGRTDVPAEKLAELAMLTGPELKREARSIKAVESQFVDILSKSLERPGSIGGLLKSIDNKVFSQDHDWREIVHDLGERGEEYDELRRVVLVKYMQYLTARQEVIKQIYKVKKHERALAAEAAGNAAAGDVSQEIEIPGEDRFRETAIFDSQLIDQQDQTEQSFTRLPKGEPLEIRLANDASTELMLSRHAFRYVNSGTGRLEDDAGRHYELAEGKNIIGRDGVCNIVIDGAYRDVSRLHMVIEKQDDGSIRFTDLSSHGTFLPTGYFSRLRQ